MRELSINFNKDDRVLLKKANIEIIGFCKVCGETYCSLEENILIKECEKCKKGGYIINVARIDEVIILLRKLNKVFK
jgi:hypothetical protein